MPNSNWLGWLPKPDWWDLMVAGTGAICYGLWQIYQPAAWIAGGICLLLLGWRLRIGIPK